MTSPPGRANLMLLADGRFPSGAHAHSAGLEQAIERGAVSDENGLHDFLLGALGTTLANSAAFCAAAHHAWNDSAGSSRADRLAELDLEESARIPSPALRAASRAQGRQFLRAVAGSFDAIELPAASELPAAGPHLSLAQGVAAAALGVTCADAALLTVYGGLTGPATAAVRLLGLDPFAVNRVVTGLWGTVETVVDRAVANATLPPAELARRTAPLLEIGAEVHLSQDLRMFAS